MADAEQLPLPALMLVPPDTSLRNAMERAGITLKLGTAKLIERYMFVEYALPARWAVRYCHPVLGFLRFVIVDADNNIRFSIAGFWPGADGERIIWAEQVTSPYQHTSELYHLSYRPM